MRIWILAMIAVALIATGPTEGSGSTTDYRQAAAINSERRPSQERRLERVAFKYKGSEKPEIRSPKKVVASTLLAYLAISHGASDVKTRKTLPRK